jgi:predicted LPLAT superfamily acyltransferase
MSFRPCAIIPTRNHWQVLPEIAATLAGNGLPVFIIDDGSDARAAEAIAALNSPALGVEVVRHAETRGKGAAVSEGFRRAHARGFTHAVQVDADGQHDLSRLPDLLAAARAQPEAVISGAPIYDETLPTARRIGRWITHLLVFLETLSFRITDSMCGFRVYPLEPTLALLGERPFGARMDFDTDIMVRLFWRGVPPVMLPVGVTYPPGNISNFRYLRDNARMVRLHVRLLLTLLLRLPRILADRPPPPAQPAHWAEFKERGGFRGACLAAALYRWLGRGPALALISPAIVYFHLSGGPRRRSVREYLRRVLGREPSRLETLRLTFDFAARALETLGAWSGSIPPTALEIETRDTLEAMKADPRGRLLVVSHHGNADLARALIEPALRQRLTVLVHTQSVEQYQRLLRQFSPEAAERTLQVTEIGPDTAILLRERIERGDWIAIAADRVPILSQRTVPAPFLGAPAPFSQGPWILATLLDCPVSLLFCRRTERGSWRLSVEAFAEEAFEPPRESRAEALAAAAARYAARLEQECRRAPWQWYNFFDFWSQGDKG